MIRTLLGAPGVCVTSAACVTATVCDPMLIVAARDVCAVLTAAV